MKARKSACILTRRASKPSVSASTCRTRKHQQCLHRSEPINKFISGPVTKWSAPCNCSTVPCLTEGQIEELLDISLKTAIADAQKVIPTFASLCCPVQNVMVDMSFTFGGPRFAQFTTFSKLVVRQYWKAAGDDLTVSLWCTQATARCMEDANIVRSGCGCSQPYPQSCDSQGSTCCASATQQTCCKGELK